MGMEAIEMVSDLTPGREGLLIEAPDALRQALESTLPDLEGNVDKARQRPEQHDVGGSVIAHRDGHWEDVNLDGIMDLLLHFRTQDTGITCGDESATLTGELLDGHPIEGTDTIQTVGCRVPRWPAIWTKDQDTPDTERRDGPVNFEKR